MPPPHPPPPALGGPLHLPLTRPPPTPPPPYRAPHLIHTYSHLPSRSISHSDDSMAYYTPAPLGVSLKEGFERRVERADEDEHLDGLVESLEVLGRREEQGERKGGVITWRGMVTRLLTAPYEYRDPWEMTAFALDGSVYLELYDPPEARAKRAQEQAAWAEQSYMGYAYEAYSTISQEGRPEGGPPGWGGDVNTNVQWANVVRSAVGDIPLCLGGEVDCVRAEPGSPNPGLSQCLELKTNKVIHNAKQDSVFHKKLLKHWAQSWLLGIPEVVVGFRDDAGILHSQTHFETAKIPRFVASTPNPAWSPAPCLHHLHSILSFLTTHILPTDPLVTYPSLKGNLGQDEEMPPAVMWRLAFTPKRGYELRTVGEVGVVEGRWGGVLREEYVRWRMGQE
ncbi:decapping nuclease RAI1 [Cryptococcus sp. DSM 104549]